MTLCFQVLPAPGRTTEFRNHVHTDMHRCMGTGTLL
jgi:hypothetical protein